MNVIMYKNNSSENLVNKSIIKIAEIDCKVTEPVSVMYPKILISESNLYNGDINYAMVFNRYYFIDSIVKLNNGMVEVQLREDFLSTLFNKVNIIGTIVRSSNNYNSDLNQQIPVQVNKQTKRIIFDENKSNVEGRTIIVQTPLPIRVKQ